MLTLVSSKYDWIAHADSVDQDQTAQNVKSDLGSTMSDSIALTA